MRFLQTGTVLTLSALALAGATIGAQAGLIEAGLDHTCALKGSVVKCWGWNFSGQLGDGTTQRRLSAVAVRGLGIAAVSVATGGSHTCVLTGPPGGVKCWGNNFFGQLGIGAFGPNKLLPGNVRNLIEGVRAIAASENHTCAIIRGGRVVCWGANFNGQLGDGTKIHRNAWVPVKALTGAIAIAAGAAHTCAIVSGGAVKCWGSNRWGQLGDGTTTDRLTPALVRGLTGGATAIALGNSHSCIRNAAGAAKCWGKNNIPDYQLGDGTGRQRNTPVFVKGLTRDIVSIGSNWNNHTCAINRLGGAKCWGKNSSGQVGAGNKVQLWSPRDVTGLSRGVAAITGGSDHTCALLRTGGAKCWGAGAVLGNGSLLPSLAPVTVRGL